MPAFAGSAAALSVADLPEADLSDGFSAAVLADADFVLAVPAALDVAADPAAPVDSAVKRTVLDFFLLDGAAVLFAAFVFGAETGSLLAAREGVCAPAKAIAARSTTIGIARVGRMSTFNAFVVDANGEAGR